MESIKRIENNNNFIEFIVSFQKYLNLNEFEVTSSDIEDFFKCISLFEIKIEDKNRLSEMSMPIFCKNKTQKSNYSSLFNKFYDKRVEVILPDKNADDFKKITDEMKKLKNEKNKLLDLKKKGDFLENKKNTFPSESLKTILSYTENEKTKKLLKKFGEKGLTQKEAKELNKNLKPILNRALGSNDFDNVADELLKVKNTLNRIINSRKLLTIDEINLNIEKYSEKEDDVKKKLEKGLEDLIANKDIYKEKSIIHRTEWTKNHGTVRSDYLGDIDLDKNFKNLSSQEKNMVKDFIKSQAIKFRTRATRDIKSKSKSKIDFKQTMKKATETGGIPLRIAYEKPKLNKSKIVMFLDISGSCKDASELMIHFMYTVKEVFQGGIKCYVFVNRLYDISDYLNYASPEKSIKKVFETVPTSGVYSNYYNPFKNFVNENLYEITKDTIVYFIGDARNNKNPIGDENIKTISRKAKKSFWLNTEDSSKWGKNDSIIYEYMPYMNSTFEVLNTRDLLYSIENMF